MRLIVALAIAAELVVTAEARGQAEATLVPALSVSTVHDDNLFSTPSAIGDVVTYLRPSLEGEYQSRTMTLQSLVSIDMQRSSRHSTLNILDARRHAMFEGRVRSSPSLLLGLAARYDRTETPSDLNLETGILLGRQRATRLQFTPSVAYRMTPRTTLTTNYDWTNEALAGTPGTTLHAARVTLGREWSPRTTLNASYLGRLVAEAPVTYRSHTAMFGGSRELAPGTSISLHAGPRARSHGGLTAEVSAALIRRTPRRRFLVDYWRGETIVLGIVGPVEIHSGTTRANWAVRRRLELGVHLGVFNSTTLDARQATVYHTSLTSVWTAQPYILAVSYGLDLQRGDIRGIRAADEEVRRGVFLVRLTIAPRLSRAFRPPDDADQPTTPLKGVLQ